MPYLFSTHEGGSFGGWGKAKGKNHYSHAHGQGNARFTFLPSASKHARGLRWWHVRHWDLRDVVWMKGCSVGKHKEDLNEGCQQQRDALRRVPAGSEQKTKTKACIRVHITRTSRRRAFRAPPPPHHHHDTHRHTNAGTATFNSHNWGTELKTHGHSPVEGVQ